MNSMWNSNLKVVFIPQFSQGFLLQVKTFCYMYEKHTKCFSTSFKHIWRVFCYPTSFCETIIIKDSSFFLSGQLQSALNNIFLYNGNSNLVQVTFFCSKYELRLKYKVKHRLFFFIKRLNNTILYSLVSILKVGDNFKYINYKFSNLKQSSAFIVSLMFSYFKSVP